MLAPFLCQEKNNIYAAAVSLINNKSTPFPPPPWIHSLNNCMNIVLAQAGSKGEVQQ